MSTTVQQEKEYKITKDSCQAILDNNGGVCNQCGGKLVPIETVDNSDNPTFWGGCESCQRFHWGTHPIVFQIAKEMVLNHNYVHYSHLGANYGKTGEELLWWQHSQIAGTCATVQTVLKIHKSMTINGYTKE